MLARARRRPARSLAGVPVLAARLAGPPRSAAAMRAAERGRAGGAGALARPRDALPRLTIQDLASARQFYARTGEARPILEPLAV